MKFQTAQEIDVFVAMFEEWSLPASDWTHEAHIVVATWYLLHGELDTATNTIRKNIKAFNIAKGGKNTDTTGYHETITIFYMDYIHQLLAEVDPYLPNIEKVRYVLSSNLSNTHYVYQYYSKPKLLSKEARLAFIPPDIKHW